MATRRKYEMKDRGQKCRECGSSFGGPFISHTAKYCSEDCRKAVRVRVNFANKERRKIRISSATKDDIEFVVVSRLRTIRYRAQEAKLEFSLTKEQVAPFYKAKCHYCDEQIPNIGFDRVENDRGYHLDNIVPCCIECNMMKRTQDVDLFIERCARIVNIATLRLGA